MYLFNITLIHLNLKYRRFTALNLNRKLNSISQLYFMTVFWGVVCVCVCLLLSRSEKKNAFRVPETTDLSGACGQYS